MSTTALETNAVETLRAVTVDTRDFDSIHHHAVRQAVLLRRSFPISSSLDLAGLADTIGVDIVTLPDMPVPGTAFRVGGAWRIAVSDQLSTTEQLHAALHEFKHILDHPNRIAHAKGVEVADYELVADLFATMALGETGV